MDVGLSRMGDDHIALAVPAGEGVLSEINGAIQQTVAQFGDSYQAVDLPGAIREAMEQVGLPANFPFPVYRLGSNWALVKVPAKRWKRLRSQYRHEADYAPGGDEERFHLYPISSAARLVVTYAIFPGGRGYCPGEIIIDPHAEGQRQPNPCGLRFVKVINMDGLMADHELAAHDVIEKPGNRFPA